MRFSSSTPQDVDVLLFLEAHHLTRREMELKDYIEKRGEESLAKELKVSVSTIRSWRYSTRQPSVNQAKKLIKMTGLRS